MTSLQQWQNTSRRLFASSSCCREAVRKHCRNPCCPVGYAMWWWGQVAAKAPPEWDAASTACLCGWQVKFRTCKGVGHVPCLLLQRESTTYSVLSRERCPGPGNCCVGGAAVQKHGDGSGSLVVRCWHACVSSSFPKFAWAHQNSAPGKKGR